MKKHIGALVAILALVGCQSTSEKQTENASTNSSKIMELMNQASLLNTLVGNVSSQLPVTTEQAAGGVTSLLSYAQNALPSSQSSELTSMLGGVNLSSLGQTASSSDQVSSSFSALGLDSSMIGQFLPIIIQVLQSQGASSSLLSGLGGLFS
ncbi:DUF2780 domain-containing protein [Vibrio ziniensis]|uniref:DUF2780 domain-containing protein n=1 Tax=Vibrio ziniensis TaxID=2711221 RepID=A0A6G7CPK1_9VIBR|nr:DUF2780 domain-containing protein [Vibrio ziniensis]QIH43976.1 DUF2780 domain-containing protein [Vibrio ziniensis]